MHRSPQVEASGPIGKSDGKVQSDEAGSRISEQSVAHPEIVPRRLRLVTAQRRAGISGPHTGALRSRILSVRCQSVFAVSLLNALRPELPN